MPRKVVTRTATSHPAPTPLSTPCRLWQGPDDGHGYGLRPDGTRQHRWVVESIGFDQFGTAWDADLVVMHLCDNRPCFRYDHLRLGTVHDNNNDAIGKGRLTGAPAKTHCVNGHEFTERNTYVAPDGRRRCRACRNKASIKSAATRRRNERNITTMTITTESQAH